MCEACRFPDRDDYTPITHDVETAFVYAQGVTPVYDQRRVWFQEWLAETIRQAKAEAWDERKRLDPVLAGIARNPYRNAAGGQT